MQSEPWAFFDGTVLQMTQEDGLPLFDKEYFGKGSMSRARPAEGTGEPLQLSFEEGFYLAFHRNAIKIAIGPNEFLSREEAFQEFCRQTPFFPVTFHVYRYFREKKWFVRSGLKYGAEYLLYIPDNSKHTHAVYAAIIRCRDAAGADPLRSSPAAFFWGRLQAANRLAGQVAKKVVLVDVKIPKPLAEMNESDLEGIQIVESMISRWEPDRERESSAPPPPSSKQKRKEKSQKENGEKGGEEGNVAKKERIEEENKEEKV